MLTFQVEDEIAAMTATIGAAFAGAMAVTASSGPGIALKGEGMGLAVMTELPMIIINVQRGGPSTGLPTKTEQADLFQAMLRPQRRMPDARDRGERPGRLLRRRPGSLADRRAVHDAGACCSPTATSPTAPSRGGFPMSATLAEDRDQAPRPAARTATPSCRTSATSGSPGPGRCPARRAWSTASAASKSRTSPATSATIRRTTSTWSTRGPRRWPTSPRTIPPQKLDGPATGDVLVLSWGGTYGACATAVHTMQACGHAVTHCHLRYLNPLPNDLGDILKRFKKVLIPELNLGQLRTIIRDKYLVDAIGLNKVQGKPFSVAEVEAKIEEIVTGKKVDAASNAPPKPKVGHGRLRPTAAVDAIQAICRTTDTIQNTSSFNHHKA